MSALAPDYDSDPERWRSWKAPQDVQDMVAPRVRGPVLDVGCGEGRLAARLAPEVRWVGVDSSPAQLADNPFGPLVRADMEALPFRDGAFAEVVHLWCLYHLRDPTTAILEAQRVLRTGGTYFACTSARDNDPELVPDGSAPTTFDAEDAEAIVSIVFGDVESQRWDRSFFALETLDEVRAYCRAHHLPASCADGVEVPLWLTKRGVLVHATKV